MKRFKQPTTPYVPTVAFDTGTGTLAFGEQRKEDLERFCELLNSTERPQLREHLRELVKAWQESGPNLEQMMWGSHSHIRDYLSAPCSSAFWMPTTGGRAMLFPSADYYRLQGLIGRERVFREEPDGAWKLNPEAEAWKEFGYFTLNPHCEELAGPCARCGNYYVKKRASQKVYCSRRCGNASTAVVRTRARLKAEHKEKLNLAKSAIREWNALAPRPALDWKQWFAKHVPDVSPKFVTRWINKNKLPRPKEHAAPRIGKLTGRK
jgi:hypothetical protein